MALIQQLKLLVVHERNHLSVMWIWSVVVGTWWEGGPGWFGLVARTGAGPADFLLVTSLLQFGRYEVTQTVWVHTRRLFNLHRTILLMEEE